MDEIVGSSVVENFNYVRAVIFFLRETQDNKDRSIQEGN